MNFGIIYVSSLEHSIQNKQNTFYVLDFCLPMQLTPNVCALSSAIF